MNVHEKARQDRVFMALCLSGGGSRAAYFASSVMMRLDRIMPSVDAISSVSGGSIAGAYYCMSHDPGDKNNPTGLLWRRDRVEDLMTRNYSVKGIANRFWPVNIVRTLFTGYDATDIMAETFQDNLFSVAPFQPPLTFKDLNTARPYLIINATNATENIARAKPFGNTFTFTHEDFSREVASDITEYSMARAVMASCAFPGLFNCMTLRNFRDRSFLHLYDGGVHDNLGLCTLERILCMACQDAATDNRAGAGYGGQDPCLCRQGVKKRGNLKQILQRIDAMPDKPYDHYVVILVDAHTTPKGGDRDDPDPRGIVSRLIPLDMNVLDSVDTFLTIKREAKLHEYRTESEKNDRFTFLHFSFENLDDGIDDVPHLPFGIHGEMDLRRRLNEIPTSLHLTRINGRRIDTAVDWLLARKLKKEIEKVDRILQVQRDNGSPAANR
ncbi:MAG: patatin-like phospholipase family protein [Desulfobacterales bacterium]|nr:patatin-like phospholipase family protein [Desulfobacterales bacterium]